jgi:ribosomal protein L32
MSGEQDGPAGALRVCSTCGRATPSGRFCVRCGAPLGAGLRRSRNRLQFAAAPGEHRAVPWLVSTLFPALPHGSMRHFRIALATGTGLVVALGALRLFPIALISAALLTPLLMGLYFYDVEIYEREPLWACGWTLAWGAGSGVAVGLLAKALAPRGEALIDRGSTAHVVTGGILLPTLGVALMLAGPLVLLRHRRFNEVLDGAGFGCACAAAFAAAQALVVGVDVLGAGVRPAGAVVPWVLRLVTLAIATPVLSMSAIGTTTASLWLRYRAPVGDRGALGVIGWPAVAIGLAAVLVLAGAIGETFMAAGVWLGEVVVLDVIALALLRRALHLGLLEDASAMEIGPPIRCANCQEMSAAHTFCANCGVALKALPKARDAPRGTSHGRLATERGGWRSGRRRLLAYALGTVAILAAGLILAAAGAPAARKAVCMAHAECGAPPELPRALFTFAGYTPWQSSGLGYSLRYDSEDWRVDSQDPDGVELESSDGSGLLSFSAAPAAQVTPAGMLAGEVSSLKGDLLGFAADRDPSDELLGTNVGLRSGPGGVYLATITSPQAPQTPVSVAIMAATNGRVSIAATVITPADDEQEKSVIYQQADDIISSVQWASP